MKLRSVETYMSARFSIFETAPWLICRTLSRLTLGQASGFPELVKRHHRNRFLHTLPNPFFGFRRERLANVFPFLAHRGSLLNLDQVLSVDRFRLADRIHIPVRIACFIAAQDEVSVPARVEGEEDAVRLALMLPR